MLELFAKYSVSVPSQCSDLRTPLTLRVNNREWNLPIDAPLHYAVTRVHVLETGDSPIDPSQINVTVTRNVNPIGPYHDTSDYFNLFKLKSSNLRNGIQYEVYLSKSLLEPEGKFQAGDQFTLELRAQDRRANHVVKLEIYGRIEEARSRAMHLRVLPTNMEKKVVAVTYSPVPQQPFACSDNLFI